MINIFKKSCDMQWRNEVLPVNYSALVGNGYDHDSFYFDFYEMNCISICAALNRCCAK